MLTRTKEEEITRRSFSLRAESMKDDGHGGGKGVACALGVLDAYRSVWSPKAFGKPVLSAFVRSGFISDGHDWSDDLATIDAAAVRGNELEIEWTWYPTEDAQEMRQKVQARVERKKDVGLSIGAAIDWSLCADFDSGEKLWTYAEGLGEPMNLYDPAIRKHKGYCWIIPKVTRLVETAITQVPAVPGSAVSAIRALNDLTQDGSRGELSFADELEMVLGAVQGVEARALDIEALRAETNGRIGRDNLRRIEALKDSLAALLSRSSQPIQRDELAQRFESIEIQRRLANLRG